MSAGDLIEKAKQKFGFGDPNDKADQEAADLVRSYVKEAYKMHGTKPRDLAAGRAILDESDGEKQVRVVLACYEYIQRERGWQAEAILLALLARNLPWTDETLIRAVKLASAFHGWSITYAKWPALARQTRRWMDAAGNAPSDDLLAALREAHGKVKAARDPDSRKAVVALSELLGDSATAMPDAGETWADRALSDLSAVSDETRAAWGRLLGFVQAADGSKPSGEWRKQATALTAALGDDFAPRVCAWFALVAPPPVTTTRHVQRMANGQEYAYSTHEVGGSDRNIGLLKGLAWACADRAEPEVARALARLVEGCLKKIPGTGPWAVRAAGAGVWALAESPGEESVAALARLKQRVTYRATLNQVERALEEAAKKRGVTKDDLEDLAVPAFGLGPDGKRREEFGEYAAELWLTPDGEATLAYYGPGGKLLKSAPAALKSPEFAEDAKALKADADAAGKMLTAQKQRIDNFYLSERSWPYAAWRERYAEHPLLGHLSRRLIWRVTDADGGRTVDVLPTEGGTVVGIGGETVATPADNATVTLWHPVQSPTEETLRWRALLEARGVRQPFKQAHREVYLLTDAERATDTYSNRFAGHIIKQHQFNQLAALRGWKNRLRLMVDDSYEPPTRELTRWGLRAEFWVEGVGDDYGADTTDSGSYLYLATDQVRFYPVDARANYAHAGGGGYGVSVWQGAAGRIVDPLPLPEVPPLVLSEILRDVDLFVGVASVGNDPNWSDGGPAGRHRDYWSDYAFGALSATAQTRRAVLEKLLPRLKIRDRAELDGRFLRVRGDRRAYKIHLGSGNILMEPDDQYLCIVEARGAAVKDAASGGGLFLPFEGDQRLSLILSKAFLLADDTNITDPTILSQINRAK